MRLAVLIDADNASAKNVTALLTEITSYGTAQVRRAYGDWASAALTGWKNALLAHSIQPIQQFAYTTGKNATDAALIIDAMDLLYTGRIDGFCLVSSDSDFTPLARRLRESGVQVLGFGERKTPHPFVVACDKFVYLENLAPPTTTTTTTAANGARPPAVAGVETSPNSATAATDTLPSSAELRGDTTLLALLHTVVASASDDEGFAPLAEVGGLLVKQQPDFDSRTYGYPKLSGLFKAVGLFEMEHRVPGEGKPPVVYVRDARHRHRAGPAA